MCSSIFPETPALSQNLRAIAVRGSQRYLSLAHDGETLSALGRKLAKEYRDHPQSWDLQQRGTPGLVEPLNTGGILPTRNFRQGAFEGVRARGQEHVGVEVDVAAVPLLQV